MTEAKSKEFEKKKSLDEILIELESKSESERNAIIDSIQDSNKQSCLRVYFLLKKQNTR